MRLVQLKWAANPETIEKPIFVDPDQVAAVCAQGEGSIVFLKSTPPLVIGVPPLVVIEQLFEGYNETRH